MQLEIRCSQLSVTPSDPSGFVVTAEVCDAHELIRQVIFEMDEHQLRSFFGDREFDRDVKRVEEIVREARFRPVPEWMVNKKRVPNCRVRMVLNTKIP